MRRLHKSGHGRTEKQSFTLSRLGAETSWPLDLQSIAKATQPRRNSQPFSGKEMALRCQAEEEEEEENKTHPFRDAVVAEDDFFLRHSSVQGDGWEQA